MKTIYHLVKTRRGARWLGLEVDDGEVADRLKDLRQVEGHIACYVRSGSIDDHRDEMDEKLANMVMNGRE